MSAQPGAHRELRAACGARETRAPVWCRPLRFPGHLGAWETVPSPWRRPTEQPASLSGTLTPAAPPRDPPGVCCLVPVLRPLAGGRAVWHRLCFVIDAGAGEGAGPGASPQEAGSGLPGVAPAQGLPRTAHAGRRVPRATSESDDVELRQFLPKRGSDSVTLRPEFEWRGDRNCGSGWKAARTRGREGGEQSRGPPAGRRFRPGTSTSQTMAELTLLFLLLLLFLACRDDVAMCYRLLRPLAGSLPWNAGRPPSSPLRLAVWAGGPGLSPPGGAGGAGGAGGRFPERFPPDAGQAARIGGSPPGREPVRGGWLPSSPCLLASPSPSPPPAPPSSLRLLLKPLPAP